MTKKQNTSFIARLFRFLGGESDNGEVFSNRRPTPEEARTIEFLKHYARPITRVLVAARDSDHVVNGPHLGYLTLKGQGSDLYPARYALARISEDLHGMKTASNRYFCYEWEIEGSGYIYLLPVLDEDGRLSAVDYITRGVVYVNNANMIARHKSLDQREQIEARLRQCIDLWARNGDSWRTVYASRSS